MVVDNEVPRQERKLSTVNAEKQAGMVPVSAEFELRSKLLMLASAVSEHRLLVVCDATFGRLTAATEPLVQVTPAHPEQYEGLVPVLHELKAVGLFRAVCNACRAAKSSA